MLVAVGREKMGKKKGERPIFLSCGSRKRLGSAARGL